MQNKSRLEAYRRWHKLAQPYFKWQFEQFKPFVGQRIADIGCGLGNLTGFMQDRDLYIAFDIDNKLLEELRHTHENQRNVEIYEGDILTNDSLIYLREKKLDTIICMNVLEHIEDDVMALKNMLGALPKGGALCLLVPAMPFIIGALDYSLGHVRRYDKKILQQKLHGLPINIEKMYYFNLIGALGWWWKSKILKQTRQTDINYKLMNMFIPVMRKLEKTFPIPFGMSLIAIVRRI